MGARLPRERKTGGGGSALAKETKPGVKVVRKSECLVVPPKQGNAPGRTPWREGGTGTWNRGRERWRRHRAPTTVSTKLQRIATLASSPSSAGGEKGCHRLVAKP